MGKKADSGFLGAVNPSTLEARGRGLATCAVRRGGKQIRQTVPGITSTRGVGLGETSTWMLSCAAPTRGNSDATPGAPEVICGARDSASGRGVRVAPAALLLFCSPRRLFP